MKNKINFYKIFELSPFVLILLIIVYLFYVYVICYEVWTEIAYYKTGNFVVNFPESDLTLIFEIDKVKFPADWHCYGTSNNGYFLVAGYGHCGSTASYGSVFYVRSYNWIKQIHFMEIFSHKIEIHRGKWIKIGNQQFRINRNTPLVLEISTDGKVQSIP
jgi:hypothetical protein